MTLPDLIIGNGRVVAPQVNAITATVALGMTYGLLRAAVLPDADLGAPIIGKSFYVEEGKGVKWAGADYRQYFYRRYSTVGTI